jgi:hypothetical protein
MGIGYSLRHTHTDSQASKRARARHNSNSIELRKANIGLFTKLLYQGQNFLR